MKTYHCTHCKKKVKRNSTKSWIKSFCIQCDKYVYLVRIDKRDNKFTDIENWDEAWRELETELMILGLDI